MKSLLNALKEGRLVELPDTDKEKALVFLAHLIEAVPDLGVSVDLVEAMLAREKAANTGLGHGVACPHVRASGSGELLCAAGWSPNGIDYGSTDGKKVHLVLMYFMPDSQKNVYLKEVSSLAAAIHKAGDVTPIATAEDLTTVRDRLLDWVSAALESSIPESKARMIRLEARHAAAEPAAVVVATSQLQVVAVRVVTLGDGKALVLSQNPDLVQALEKAEDIAAKLQAQAQLEIGGFKLVCQSSSQYEAGRALYEYLAIKA